MAARRSTGTTLHRKKEGVLELKKSDGLKKSWKPFHFKVSAATYLLCFKTTDLSKPDAKILLPNVTQVLPSASKSASYPFEVVFKGKGSPWKLNACSNEERISWMEAILPGSSDSVTRFQKAMRDAAQTPPPQGFSPPPQGFSPPPLYSNGTPMNYGQTPAGNISPGVGPPERAQPNAYVISPTKQASYLSVDDSDGEDFLTASLGPPPDPQEYLSPTETQSLKNPSGGQGKIHAPPKRGMSDGEVTKPKPKPSPRPRRQTNPPQKGHETIPTTDDSSYVTMLPSPVRRHPAVKTAASDGQLPDYLSAQEEPEVDEYNYVLPDSPSAGCPVPDRDTSMSDSIQSSASGYSRGVESGNGATNLADTISRSFDRDQIGLLIHMLQEVRGDKQQTKEDESRAWEVGSPSPGPTSPGGYCNEQDSITLRGNLERALSYVPEKCLVTEEDSDESYQVRPPWAKAVHPDLQSPTSDELDTLSDLQHEALYISKNDIAELQIIGQGQFGKVFKGVLRRGSESMQVAVKMTKKTISEYLQQSFLKEMSIMSEMMHPNIVRMYGLVDEESPWIVLEYMKHGDLKTFLTKNQRQIQQLVKYMVDVAMGMHYISERGLVHRDLAARNVLVGENEICKVADFGLLREIPRDDSIYHSQHNVPCPIRWMPPESISDRKFSAASDVWSFGVLVWEMFNPTKLPYDTFDNMTCAIKVNEGYHMPVPRGTPPIISRIMKACWHKNPNKRPSFLLISTLLTKTII